MFLTIKNKKEFCDGFLSTISKMDDKAVLTIRNGKIYSIMEGQHNVVFLGLYNDESIQVDEEMRLNIGNFKNFHKLVDNISETEFNLKINSNNVEYKSKGFEFKYLLLDKSLIKENSSKLDKICSVKGDVSFEITGDELKDILKMGSIVNETNKVYFYTKDSEVFCDITDKTLSSSNSITLKISSEFQSDSGNGLSKLLPIHIEVIRILSTAGKISSIKVGISAERIFIFDIETSEKTCFRYITSVLVN